jgi:hypothetical protein
MFKENYLNKIIKKNTFKFAKVYKTVIKINNNNLESVKKTVSISRYSLLFINVVNVVHCHFALPLIRVKNETLKRVNK